MIVYFVDQSSQIDIQIMLVVVFFFFKLCSFRGTFDSETFLLLIGSAGKIPISHFTFLGNASC